MDVKIFEAMPGCSVLLQANAPEFTVAAATEGFLQQDECGKEELVGKSFLKHLEATLQNNNELDRIKASLLQAATGGQPHTFRAQRRSTLHSTHTHYTIRHQPVLNEAGQVTYIIHTAENVAQITPPAPQQERMRLIEQAYNLLMKAPVAFCIIRGPEQLIELANKPVLEIWRKGPEVVGKTLLEALPEIKDSVFPALLHQVRQSGQPHFSNESHTYFIRNGKEELVYFNFVYQPFYEAENAEASGVLVIATEVTEMVMARKKVEESELRFRNLIAEADVATAIYTGPDMRIQYANEAMIRLWGKDGSVIGKTIPQALPELEGQPFHQLLQHVYTTGETYLGKEDKAELVVDGKLQPFYFNFSYKALRNADGSIYGILNMAIDVTTAVQARQKLEENEATLQKRVAERTLELENKNKELQHMNANLEEFAFAASHDLKEPVRKIHFFSDRLAQQLDARLTDEEQRTIGRIQHAARRMGTLIDDLLTYSHVSRGATLLEDVNLNLKVAGVLEDLELEIAEKQAHIVVDPLPVIKGNRRQLQQLFQNLISNALKYSRPGEPPHIHVHAEQLPGAQTRLPLSEENKQKHFHKIEITDNGIGFNQKDAERIFNVFTRLHGNAEYRGTGIGLSIVQKVVENHKGFITAEGMPGQGASFTIFLPADNGQSNV